MQVTLNPIILSTAIALSLVLATYACVDRAQALAANQTIRAEADDALLAMVAPPVGLTVTAIDTWNAR